MYGHIAINKVYITYWSLKVLNICSYISQLIVLFIQISQYFAVNRTELWERGEICIILFEIKDRKVCIYDTHDIRNISVHN